VSQVCLRVLSGVGVHLQVDDESTAPPWQNQWWMA